MIYLSLDPSLTATGAVLAEDGRVLRSKCFRTEPSPKQLKLAVGVDDADRMRRVLDDITEFVGTDLPQHVIAELPSGMMHIGAPCGVCKSRRFSARGLETTGLSKMLVVALAWRYCARPTWIRPMDVKRVLTGDKHASKDQIVASAVKHGLELPKSPKPVREAIADAYCVLIASGLWRPAPRVAEVSAT